MTVPTPAATGTELTRLNALRHGILSRFTVLPWETEAEYLALLAALAAEHAPQGPTEEHLVEELAGILWRKRRLRLAEAALYRDGLEGTFASFRDTVKAAVAHLRDAAHTESVADAVRATEADTAADLRDVEQDEAMTRKALDLLASARPDCYAAALAALRPETRGWWDEAQSEAARRKATASGAPDEAGLRRFLESEALPWFAARRSEIAARPLIRDQAFGEALDPEKLDRLARYEVHLDRKLEPTLAILVRLRELRAGAAEGA